MGIYETYFLVYGGYAPPEGFTLTKDTRTIRHTNRSFVYHTKKYPVSGRGRFTKQEVMDQGIDVNDIPDLSGLLDENWYIVVDGWSSLGAPTENGSYAFIAHSALVSDEVSNEIQEIQLQYNILYDEYKVLDARKKVCENQMREIKSKLEELRNN